MAFWEIGKFCQHPLKKTYLYEMHQLVYEFGFTKKCLLSKIKVYYGTKWEIRGQLLFSFFFSPSFYFFVMARMSSNYNWASLQFNFYGCQFSVLLSKPGPIASYTYIIYALNITTEGFLLKYVLHNVIL